MIRYCLVIICFLSLLLPVVAEQKTVFNDQLYEEVTKGYDFTENAAPKKKEVKAEKSVKVSPVFFLILQAAIIIAVVIGIAFILFSLLAKRWKSDPASTRKKVTGGSVFSEELDLEENLHDLDLDKLLEDRINRQAFKDAVRIYYLMIIKQLNQRHLIRFSKNKTNAEYISEMSAHALQPDFRKATRYYEQVWYGDLDISESEFKHIQPLYTAFIQSASIAR